MVDKGKVTGVAVIPASPIHIFKLFSAVTLLGLFKRNRDFVLVAKR